MTMTTTHDGVVFAHARLDFFQPFCTRLRLTRRAARESFPVRALFHSFGGCQGLLEAVRLAHAPRGPSMDEKNSQGLSSIDLTDSCGVHVAVLVR